MKQINSSLIVYSSATANYIPQNVISLYEKWRDCDNSYKDYHFVMFCNACEEIGKQPLKVQDLILSLY